MQRYTGSICSISEMIPNDQPAMRPIIKRPHSVPSLKTDRCLLHRDAPFPLHGVQQMGAYQSAVIRANVLPSYMCIINAPKNTAHCWTDWYESKKIFKINENAVRLDDIDDWWYTENETVCIPSVSYHKEYDDTDLDLFLIHREAQEYNDNSDYQQKLDLFFLKSILHQVIDYLRDSWFELTQAQRIILYYMTNQKQNPSVCLFDHFLWFGYDCLLRSSGKELPKKTAEYNTLVKNFLLSSGIKKDANDLAVDFGIRFSWCSVVIASCNQHFDKACRKRMRYTRRFCKSC